MKLRFPHGRRGWQQPAGHLHELFEADDAGSVGGVDAVNIGNRQGIAWLDSYFDPNKRKYYITPQADVSFGLTIKEHCNL